jgi:hypothetical protein
MLANSLICIQFQIYQLSVCSPFNAAIVTLLAMEVYRLSEVRESGRRLARQLLRLAGCDSYFQVLVLQAG